MELSPKPRSLNRGMHQS